MKFKKMLSAALVAACALGCVAGCGNDAKEDPNIVKVGVFLPLTGDNAAGGQIELQGVELAHKLHPEVNGKKIQLVIADNKSDKAESANVATRLIEKDKVKVIVGSYGSSLSMAAGQAVRENKVPAIGTSCTNPQVTAGNPYYFRACFIDPFQGTVMANFAYNELKARKVAIIREISNDYSVGLTKFFIEAFKKKAGPDSIVGIVDYQTGDKDFTSQINAIKADNPDAVFAAGNFTESALLVKEAHRQGLNVPFLGADTWETHDFLHVGGKDVEGVYFSSGFDSDNVVTNEAKEFIKAYKAAYKADPDKYKSPQPSGLTALAYDAYLIAYNALKEAGTEDSTKIRDAIANTKDLECVTGMTTLDKEGDAVKYAVIKTVKDGKFTFKTIVNPED